MRATMREESRGSVRASVRRLIALVLSCLLACCVPVAAFADGDAADAASSTDEPRTIRVAFVQQPLVMWMDEDGARSGYTYEYLERIAQYAGWDYEFVPVEGMGAQAQAEAYRMLAANEVDLVAGAMAVSEDTEGVALTRESFVTLGVVLKASAESSGDPLVGRTEDAPLRVAVSEETGLTDELDAYCARSGIAYEVVNCDNATQAREAVRTGIADVLLSTDMDGLEGVRTVAHIAARPLHFAVTHANQVIADRIDEALARIDAVEPAFRQQLLQSYFSAITGSFVLSDEERAYVESAAPVRVGVLTDQPPYQYVEDGQLKGIAVQLLDAVAEKTGLTFEYVPVATIDELDARCASGELDMAAGVDYNYITAREKGLALAQPYVTASYVLVANENVGEEGLAGKRLALVESNRYNGLFLGTVVRFPTVSACLRAVFEDQADYTYVDEYVMQYFLNMPEFRNVRISPQTHQARNVRFAVVRDKSDPLLSIVDKAVGSFTEVERQAIINANVLRERPFTVEDIVRAYPIESLLIAVGICLLALVVALIFLLQRARANAKIALDLKKRLQLYALSDDYFFEFDRRTGELMLFVPSRGGEVEPLTLDSKTLSEDADEESAAFYQLLHTDESTIAEMRVPDRGGVFRWVRVTAEPVGDRAGRVAFTVGKIKVIDEERREKDRLVEQAERDSLTGLFNVEAMRQRVMDRTEALSAGERGALIIVDVDNFKDVNDTFGHPEGDRVLVDVARILRERCSPRGVTARVGGDEFMAYLDHVEDADELRTFCEEVRRVVEDHTFPTSDCRVTLSVGAVLSQSGSRFDQLYRHADEALYVAKRDGRNRCCIGEA